MFDEKTFDLCRYYGEDSSVFIDGKRKNGQVYLMIHVVDTDKKTSIYQSFIFPKETMDNICQKHRLSWFIDEFYGLDGFLKLLSLCDDNKWEYTTVKDRLL